MLMKNNNDNRQSYLPNINQFRTQPKPIKQVLKQLKQRKNKIQSRIKTQMQQQQVGGKTQTDFNIKQRLITQVPIYINRKTKYNEHMSAFDIYHNAKSSPKIDQAYEEQSQARQSKIKSQNVYKRNSMIQPILDDEKKYQSPKTHKKKLKQIQNLFVNVPVDPRDRTQSSIQQLKEYLVQNNIFFSKIHNVISTCLLKLNRIMWLEKRQTLYRIGEQKHAFYIILCGRLKIYDEQKNLKKICTSGQSVGEQLLFSTKNKKIVLETAKAITRCFLIQIKIQNFRKMNEEMIKYGYKIIFNEMESIIKRNHITKNWLRGQKQRYEKRK